MRKLVVTAILFLVVAMNQKAYATHVMGGEFEYDVLDSVNRIYRIKLSLYRDCSGIPVGFSTWAANFSNGCPTMTLTPTFLGKREVTPLCNPKPQTTCTNPGSSIKGTEVWEYEWVGQFPPGCGIARVVWDQCCRNFNNGPGSIDGNIIDQSGPVGGHLETHINTDLKRGNNSSKFLNPPVPFICLNTLFKYNHYSIDKDGDSLVFSLYAPYGDATGGQVIYKPPYSYVKPYDMVESSIQFNPVTGQFQFTPTKLQTSIMGFRVEEYRRLKGFNGKDSMVYAGMTMRDVQVSIVVACSPILFDGILKDSVKNGNFYDSTQVDVCVTGKPLEFQFRTRVNDLPWDVKLYATMDGLDAFFLDQGPIPTGYNFTYRVKKDSARLRDTIWGKFYYKTPIKKIGCRYISWNVGYCVQGFDIRNTFTAKVCFKDNTFADKDTVYYCLGGLPPTINVYGGDSFYWKPNKNICWNNTNFSTVQLCPDSTRQYIVTSNLNVANTSCKNSDTVLAILVPKFTYTLGPKGDTICQKEQKPLSLVLHPSQAPYGVKWTPGSSLISPVTLKNCDTCVSPIAIPTITTNYEVSMTSKFGCTIKDTLPLNVGGAAVTPTVGANRILVCAGDTTKLKLLYVKPKLSGLSVLNCIGGDLTAEARPTFNTSFPIVGCVNCYPSVFGPDNLSYSSKHRIVYTKADLNAGGFTGGVIKRIGFELASAAKTTVIDNLVIRFGTTLGTDANVSTILIDVFDMKNMTIGAAIGLKNFTLDRNFDWDGTSNLVVEICMRNSVYSKNNEWVTGIGGATETAYYIPAVAGQDACDLTNRVYSIRKPKAVFTYCNGDAASAGLNINWTSSDPANVITPVNGVNPTVVVNKDATFTASVSGGYNCVGTGTVAIALDTTFKPTINNDTFICTAGSIRLRLGGKVIATDSILWTSNPVNATLTPQKNTKNGVVFVNTTTSFFAKIWRTGASCIVYDTFVVTLQATIPINFTATQPYCTSSTGKLKAIPNGVPSSYTYAWKRNAAPLAVIIDSLTGIDAGTYSVTVTNPSGCTGTASYVVTPQVLTLAVDTTNKDLTCYQDGTGSITPSVTSVVPFPLTTFNYDWADLAGTSNPKNRSFLNAGNYTITVTDNTTGCIGTRTINIEEPQRLTFNSDSIKLKCFNDSSGGISWTYTGGTGPSYTMDYIHSTGIPVGNAIGGAGGVGNGVLGLKAGKYYLTLTDNNGCIVKDSTIIFEPTKLTNVMTKRDASTVGGSEGAAFSNPLGGTPNYSFTWWSDSSQVAAGIAIAGNILTRTNRLDDSLSQVKKSFVFVQITDGNGCTIKDSIKINGIPCKLGASYLIDDVKCWNQPTGQIRLKAFDTLNFTKTSKYYFRALGFAQNDSAPDNLTEGKLSGLKAGFYNVFVSTNLGCDTMYNNIEIKEPAELRAAAFELKRASCLGVSDGQAKVVIFGSFIGTAPYTYNWSAGTTPTIDSTGGLLGGSTYTVTVKDANNCESKPSVTMTLPTKVFTILAQDSVKCFGQANGRAYIANIGSGTAPYTYLWNTAAIDSFTGLVSAGEYKVEVTDARGCIMRDSIFVKQPVVLDASLSGINPTCNGFTDGEISTTSTGGNGGNSFLLAPPAITNSVGKWTALGKGNYTVTVTDMKGCQVVKNITLVEPSPLSFTTGFTNATCKESENGTAFIKNIGGGVGAPFTATWTRVSDNLDLVVAGAVPPNDKVSNLRGLESYDVTLFDKNLCPLKKTINVGVDYVLTIDNIAPEHVKCFGGSDGKATVTMANGFSPYNYVWSNPEIPGLSLGSSKIALNIPRGVYTVSVTDVNNCTALGNVEIIQPNEIQINLYPTMTLCYGSADGSLSAKYTGGTKPYAKLEWKTNPLQYGDSAIGLKAGSYSFVLTDNNGCQKTKTGIVPEPEEFKVVFDEQKHITCYGDNDGKLSVYVKGGTPNFSYLWNTTPPKTTPVIENLSPKRMYSVTATDRNNCTATGFREILEPEKLAFDHLKVDSVSCPRYADGVVDIQAIGGTISFAKQYEFSLDSINFFRYGKFTSLRKGRYTAWIRDNNGCLARRELEIFEPEELFVNANPSDTLLELSKSAKLSITKRTASGVIPYINSYKWYPGEGLNCVDCASPMTSAYESRLYEITVNYLHNCLAKSESMIRIKDPLDIFVPSAFTPGNHDGLDINDVFKVYGLAVKKVDLYVFNRLGEKVFESNNMEIGWDGNYKGEMQMPGVYTYSVQVEYLNGQTRAKKGSVTLIR